MKRQIDTSVATAVELNVNGKIRKMDAKLDAYILSDNDWKTEAQPVVNMGKQAKGFSVVTLYIAGAIITLGGAIEIVRQFFNK